MACFTNWERGSETFPGMHLRGIKYVADTNCVLVICACIWVSFALGLPQLQCLPCGQDPAGDIQSIIVSNIRGHFPGDSGSWTAVAPTDQQGHAYFPASVSQNLVTKKFRSSFFVISHFLFLSYPRFPSFQPFFDFNCSSSSAGSTFFMLSLLNSVLSISLITFFGILVYIYKQRGSNFLVTRWPNL